MTKSASELIRGGKLRTATYDVCLDPDLVEQYEQLIEEKERQREAKRDSLAGGATVELDEQIAALLEDMRESTLTLVFKALPRPSFRALMDAHPARKDENGQLTHTQDYIGANADTFFEALIPIALVEPKLSPEDLKILIEEKLTDRQWDDLTTVVWNVNRKKVDLPFSSAGSRTTPTS